MKKFRRVTSVNMYSTMHNCKIMLCTVLNSQHNFGYENLCLILDFLYCALGARLLLSDLGHYIMYIV